jgi:PAS domain S-box-containing protein
MTRSESEVAPVGIRELIQRAAPILEALHDGVAVTDTAGTVVYVNEANGRITGLVAKDLLERPVREVVPDSHLLEALLAGRSLIGVKTRVAGRAVISNIVPLWEDGQLIGAVSIFRDLTDVIRLNEQLREAEERIALLQEHLGAGAAPDGMVIGRSPAAQRAYTLALWAAAVTSAVLVEGESGTGKEVVARLIHARSDRSGKPFVAVNCAAVPGSLLESELFGYEEGAFTGARKGGRAGLFDMADGGGGVRSGPGRPTGVTGL